MAARDPLFKPYEMSPGQMFATWACALSVAAFDLGEVYSARMERKLGPQWKEKIREHRRLSGDDPRFTVHDPQWIFSEPNRGGSPVADRMPPGYSERFRRVNAARNDWFHKNIPWNLEYLIVGVETVRSAIACFDLPLRSKPELQDLAQHLQLLRTKRILPSPREWQLDQLVRDAQAQLEHANLRANQLSEELDDVLKKELENDEVAQHLREQIRREQNRAEDAQRQADELAMRLEALEGGSEVNPDDVLPVDIRPGDPWPQDVPLGRRAIRLLRPPAPGLYDPSRRVFLSTELGDVARHAALRWHRVMPLGAEIYVTDAWNAAGRVAGQMRYLGRLDEPGDQERVIGADLADFLTVRSYRYDSTGILDETNGIVLTRANPSHGEEVQARVSAAIAQAKAEQLFTSEDLEAMASGLVDLRITISGHVAVPFAGDPGYLTSVTASEWFPGHLRDFG